MTGLIWPFPGGYDPKQSRRVDQGWDLQVNESSSPGGGGGIPVYAAANGTVTYSHNAGGFGDPYPVLMLDTPITMSYAQAAGSTEQAIGIYYGHIAPAVDANKKVKAGDRIGTTLNPSGGNASGIAGGGWLEIGFWFSSGPTRGGGEKVDTPAGHEMQNQLTPGGAKPGANAAPGTSSGSGTGNTGTGSGDTSGPSQDQINQWMGLTSLSNLDDPRSNLPFSDKFLSSPMITGNGAATSTRLIRGGMAELTPRSGGRFYAFFMMNPETISFSVDVDQSNQPPQDQTPTQLAAQAFITSSQSLEFTLYFNRMYEVWSGGFPGPSDVGVIWDIRAIERLMGLYDIVIAPGASSGPINFSKYGVASSGAQSGPIEVVFGGPNSLAFQGRIMSMSYSYTRFDRDMVPIEATMDLGIMKYYNPSATTDLVGTILTAQLSGTNPTITNPEIQPTGNFVGPSTGPTIPSRPGMPS